MYNETIIEFGFCDIRNNQGLGKCNQPRLDASADYTCLDFTITFYHSTQGNGFNELESTREVKINDIILIVFKFY